MAICPNDSPPGFPVSQVDPKHVLTLEQRVEAAAILRVRSSPLPLGRGIPTYRAEGR
jgi:hypothetical protein